MVKSRILKGMMANGFGHAVTAFVQLAAIPLFLKMWGVELYGEWLILIAVSAYLTMGDLGFASVAANKMTMHVAKGDKPKAIETFQSTLAVICVTSPIAIAAVATLAYLQWNNSLLPLHLIKPLEVTIILFVIGFQVAVEFFESLAMAGLRSEGNYAVGTFCDNVVRLTEFLGAIVALLSGGGPVIVIETMLAVRLVGTISIIVLMRRKSPWLVFGFSHAAYREFRALLRPSFAFMGFPLGNALSLQGAILLIGTILNPAAVVLFATLRTLARLVTQTLAIINHSIWPEISIAYGEKNFGLVRELHHRAVQWSVWLALIGASILLVSGEWIVRHWTHGALEFDPMLFGLLLLVMIANALWFGSLVIPIAINKHENIAGIYVLAACLSLILAAAFGVAIGLYGVVLALLVGDLIMAAFVVKTSLSLLDESPRTFFAAVLSPPSIQALRYKVFDSP